jgi:hypothetical protein
VDMYQHLIRLRFWTGYLLQFELFGTSILVNTYGLHHLF